MYNSTRKHQEGEKETITENKRDQADKRKIGIKAESQKIKHRFQNKRKTQQHRRKKKKQKEGKKENPMGQKDSWKKTI